MLEPRASSANPPATENHEPAILLAREIIERFQLGDLEPLLRTVEAQTKKTELNLAVFGRFKAGKSSFLNQLLGRPLLPVGVVPVTSALTEIAYGAGESATVVFHKSPGAAAISLAEIAGYIRESENPGNCKDVKIVRVSLPSLLRFRGLKLVDTPGLDSVFSRNTEETLAWSPNVDLALVAVAADPPLTQQDVALIERLQRFTPNVAILLTKVDTLDDAGLREVLTFVENQLKSKFPRGLTVFPFSIRPGYERFRERFEQEFIANALTSFQERRAAALMRKLQTLLDSVGDYLRLAARSAETRESDREHLRTQVLGSEELLADQKLQFQLLAKHAATRTRPLIEGRLHKTFLLQLQDRLPDCFASEFPGWRGSFAQILAKFESWLQAELENELSAISLAEAGTFQESLRDFQRQCRENLEAFRKQLSESVLRVFGFPLRTTETEIEAVPPRAPDVSVGKIFDHNWELLSALIPMRLVRSAVRWRFEEKIKSEVYKNLSRLTSQWEETIRAAILVAEKEASRSFDEFVLTVRRVLQAPEPMQKSEVFSYVEILESALNGLSIHSRDFPKPSGEVRGSP
jgi:GTP-binding protein EngB required for normal cell division